MPLVLKETQISQTAISTVFYNAAVPAERLSLGIGTPTPWGATFRIWLTPQEFAVYISHLTEIKDAYLNQGIPPSERSPDETLSEEPSEASK